VYKKKQHIIIIIINLTFRLFLDFYNGEEDDIQGLLFEFCACAAKTWDFKSKLETARDIFFKEVSRELGRYDGDCIDN